MVVTSPKESEQEQHAEHDQDPADGVARLAAGDDHAGADVYQQGDRGRDDLERRLLVGEPGRDHVRSHQDQRERAEDRRGRGRHQPSEPGPGQAVESRFPVSPVRAVPAARDRTIGRERPGNVTAQPGSRVIRMGFGHRT